MLPTCTIRGRLVESPAAFITRRGETYVPDEIEALSQLAHAVGVAFDGLSNHLSVAPVLLAFAIYVVSVFINGTFFNVTNALIIATVDGISFIAMLALAAAVVYGVVRHRVMDVSFIISRTLVYTILSTIVIGVFALIDFVSGKLLGRLGFTIAFEACGALLLALSLHRLLGRVDCLVDALLFRARHLAGLRLEGAAAAVTQSETAKDVDDVLVDEACDALMLASAAIFRRDDCGDYIRVKDRGWSAEDANRLSKGDRLIAKLLTERRPLDLMTFHPTSDGLPQGFTQPLLAIPLIARRGIPGVVL